MHQFVFKDPVCCSSFTSLLFKHRHVTQERPVVTCFLSFYVCCSSSYGTESKVLLSLGVNAASIELTAQTFWIVVKLVYFLFVLWHSQDDSPALCQELEKGISGCSTLTKLSVEDLAPQYSSAIVRAAMALKSSLTEVDWICCRFDGKSNIGLTVLVYCVIWVHIGVWVVRVPSRRSFTLDILHLPLSWHWSTFEELCCLSETQQTVESDF